MKKALLGRVVASRMTFVTATIFAVALWGQQSPEAAKQALQQRVAELKQSMAQSKESLKQYQWTETTEISLKGDVKKREQKECRYGPDGEVQKTVVGGGEEAEGKKGGGRRGRRGGGRLKAKIVEKKVGELKDYGERFGSLIKRYVPPDPERLKAVVQAGNASVDRSSGDSQASLVFRNYLKDGDELGLTFDTAALALRSYTVRSYLDGPEDQVNLSVNFRSLHDNTNYVAETLLESSGKQLGIKVTNFGHRKIQ